MIIKAYIGVIGSGKDYRAKQECDIQLSFADQLREDVWKMIGWKPKTPEEYDMFKRSTFALFNGVGNVSSLLPLFTGRDLLQRYGTEVRRAEDEKHWCDCLIRRLEILSSTNNENSIGITDCRFANEVSALIKFSKRANKLGYNIQLEFIHTDFKSDRYNYIAEHESEKLAQKFAGKVYESKEFNDLIYKMYGQ